MVELNRIHSVQPNSLAKTPYGEAFSSIASIASSDFKGVRQPDASQAIESQKVALMSLKSTEVNGQIDTTALDSQMGGLNVQLQQLQKYFKFERDADSGRMVIFIQDSETDE